MSGIAQVRGRHPLATGLLAGAAVGVSLGLLFAPRRGSEVRRRMRDGVNYAVNNTSTGVRRAKGAIGSWANRSRGMYVTTRDRVVRGAQGTTRYVRDVADAVTMRGHRQSDPALRRVPVNAPSNPSGQPRKAI